MDNNIIENTGRDDNELIECPNCRASTRLDKWIAVTAEKSALNKQPDIAIPPKREEPDNPFNEKDERIARYVCPECEKSTILPMRFRIQTND